MVHLLSRNAHHNICSSPRVPQPMKGKNHQCRSSGQLPCSLGILQDTHEGVLVSAIGKRGELGMLRNMSVALANS